MADLDEALKGTQKAKLELQARHAEQKKHIDHTIIVDEGQYSTIMETANVVRIEHSKKKVRHRKMMAQLEAEKALEAKLDKELESILGRAVTMEDLEALYQ